MTDSPRLLVLGGTSKAATTSVFQALASLPEVAIAAEKECRFFLPAELNLPSRRRYPEARESFLELFDTSAAERFVLDGTPDYLHYAGSEQAIGDYFPDARVLFVLRDPVDRLVSWFRYARQRGQVDGDTGFDAFLAAQLDPADEPFAQPHRLALAHGRYAERVAAFRSVLGPERVGVLFYEDLLTEPRAFFADALRSLGLDEGHDPGALVASLPTANRTRGVKSAGLAGVYRSVVLWARFRLPGRRGLHRLLRPLKRGVDRVYWAINRSEPPVVDDAEALERLTEAYRSSVEDLRRLLDRDPPWPRWGDPGAPAKEGGHDSEEGRESS